MRLLFLGTAAAEAVPTLFCQCPCCRNAWEKGGKDVRRRCSYLLDDDTMIDYGPDVFFQAVTFHLDMTKIDRIVFTHAHADHLDEVELSWRRPGFCCHPIKPVKIIGDEAVHRKISGILSYEQGALIPCQLGPMQTITDGGLTITALRANHDPESTPLNYLFERGGKHILIANDTGMWSEENWQFLASRNVKLDLAVIESCGALCPADWWDHHLSLHSTIQFRDRLKEIGAVTDSTRCVVNHFSHNGMPMHADMEKAYNPAGLEVAYDGLLVTV